LPRHPQGAHARADHDSSFAVAELAAAAIGRSVDFGTKHVTENVVGENAISVHYSTSAKRLMFTSKRVGFAPGLSLYVEGF
jgi:hypothetical protein